MKYLKLGIGIMGLLLLGCQKEPTVESPALPPGTTPYSAEEVAFVPYDGEADQVFKRAPDFVAQMNLNFKEHLQPQTVYAWDQTFFSFEFSPSLELELRLRYLKTEEVSQKTLAIYVPYYDNAGVRRKTLFETPLTPVGLELGFFSELVTYYPEIAIEGTEWLQVFEIKPLQSTPEEWDAPGNFTRLFYNAAYGIIAMDQKNGNRWVLHP